MSEQVNIRKAEETDLRSVTAIMNSFAKNSFAVYAADLLPPTFAQERFDQAKVFLVLEINNEVIGFGFILPYKPFKNFAFTGVLTYFLREEYTGKGIGSKLLYKLFEEGKKLGITNYLAHISSKNEQSLQFHKKHGFREVGRFKEVAIKFDQLVDVVWVQKIFKPGE